MRMKKNKFPTPEVNEFWSDAMTILRYAHRLEDNPSEILEDEATRLMLSEVHNAVTTLRKSLSRDSSHVKQAAMVEQLARIYEKVSSGIIKDDEAYREAVMEDWIFASSLIEAEEPHDADFIPGIIFMDAKTIHDEGGPVAAAALSIAEFYGRGERQIKEYRALLLKGKLRPPSFFDATGIYFQSSAFRKKVMERIFYIPSEAAAQVDRFWVELRSQLNE